ncbi:MAG: dienelactone hydrolase family protein [Polyangiaceae bacterium]
MRSRWRFALGLVTVVLWGGAGCDSPPPAPAGPAASGQATSEQGPSGQATSGQGAAPQPPSAAPVDVGPAEVTAVHRYTGGAKKGDKVPLVVAIHGLGDNPESFAGLFDGFSGKAHIVLPAGGLAWGEGFAWWPIRGAIDEQNMAAGLTAAAERLGPAVREWQSEGASGKPIVTGFSQGGMLSFALVARHPELVGEAIPVSGLLPAPMVPASWPAGAAKPRVFALHGDADSRVPYAIGQRSVEALKALGLSAELRSYVRVAHAITPEMRRDLMNELTAAVERAAKEP